jgi:hypothetical protein
MLYTLLVGYYLEPEPESHKLFFYQEPDPHQNEMALTSTYRYCIEMACQLSHIQPSPTFKNIAALPVLMSCR